VKDEAYFAQVAVDPHGHTFGWNLDDFGNEIDFCPDATRIKIEEQKVSELADRYDARLAAAE
jgi:hypothetical protein